MAGIADFANKRSTKSVSFMDGKITIQKLSLEDVMGIQELTKQLEADKDSGDDKNFDILKKIIKLGTENGNDMEDDLFVKFPIDDLSKLSQEIMTYSGLDAKGK